MADAPLSLNELLGRAYIAAHLRPDLMDEVRRDVTARLADPAFRADAQARLEAARAVQDRCVIARTQAAFLDPILTA